MATIYKEVAQIVESQETSTVQDSQSSDYEECKANVFKDMNKMNAGDVIMQELDDLIEDQCWQAQLIQDLKKVFDEDIDSMR